MISHFTSKSASEFSKNASCALKRLFCKSPLDHAIYSLVMSSTRFDGVRQRQGVFVNGAVQKPRSAQIFSCLDTARFPIPVTAVFSLGPKPFGELCGLGSQRAHEAENRGDKENEI